MTICERMFKIMNEKGIKAVQLADKLGITQSVITNWKKRNTNPPIEYTINICELLGVSVYTLLGVEKKELNTKEEELLEYFRKCNTDNQKIIISAAKTMQQLEQKPELEEEKLSNSKIG